MPEINRDAVVIVGAGQAGLQVATSLREFGHRGPITLIGAEAHGPYQRPPLSKAFLKGELAEERLALRGDAYYAAHSIDLITGDAIESISLERTTAGRGRAIAASGTVFPFDHLALTVGGRPRYLPVPRSTLAGVHYLRDVADSAALRTDLAAARSVAVIGGGFIGLEIAAAANAACKNVTVLEAADRLLGRAVAPATSAFYAAAHRARGTTVEMGVTIAALTGRRRLTGVDLTDGRHIQADVVLIGIGMLPDIELAARAGLTCNGGIVVDEANRTSAAAVVAAGDCTVVALGGGRFQHAESVPNAIAQGKRAAASILNLPTPHTGVPWFWSDQNDLKLQIAGLNSGYDRTVVRGNPTTESFSVLSYRGEKLLSIEAVNHPRDYMAVRRILDTGGTVPPEAAADASRPLKQFLPVPA